MSRRVTSWQRHTIVSGVAIRDRVAGGSEMRLRPVAKRRALVIAACTVFRSAMSHAGSKPRLAAVERPAIKPDASAEVAPVAESTTQNQPPAEARIDRTMQPR